MPRTHVEPARQTALEHAHVRYNTGKPCKRGHFGERYTRSGECVACALLKNFKHPHKKMWYAARTRARQKGVDFDITPEDVLAVWPADNCCPILKTPFVPHRHGEEYTGMAATLDRIHPSIGYVRGNIAILSQYANAIKQDCVDHEIFRAVADWVEINIKKAVFNTPHVSIQLGGFTSVTAPKQINMKMLMEVNNERQANR